MVRVLPERRLRPTRLGRKPARLAMLRIWASVSGCTISGWLNARETVAGETPALRATSMMEKRGDGRAAMSLCFAYMLKTISSYKTNMTFVLHGFALCWEQRNNTKPTCASMTRVMKITGVFR